MSSPLGDVFSAQRMHLTADLQGATLDVSVDRIRQFLRGLERPLSDNPALTPGDLKVAHHALGVVAEAVRLLGTVRAVSPAKPPRRAPARDGRPLFASAYLAVLGLLNFGAAAASIYWRDLNAATVGFVALAIVACVGAVIVLMRKRNTATPAPEEAFTVALEVDGPAVSERLKASLGAVDELLAVSARTSQKLEAVSREKRLDRDALVLLQGLAAYRFTKDPEHTLDDLVRLAEQALRGAGIKCVDPSQGSAELFEEWPAMIPQRKTLRPALVDAAGRVLLRGVVLAPD